MGSSYLRLDEGRLWNLRAIFVPVNTSNVKDRNYKKGQIHFGGSLYIPKNKRKISPFWLYLVFYMGICLFYLFRFLKYVHLIKIITLDILDEQ